MQGGEKTRQKPTFRCIPDLWCDVQTRYITFQQGDLSPLETSQCRTNAMG
jgi:hypothetical protein